MDNTLKVILADDNSDMLQQMNEFLATSDDYQVVDMVTSGDVLVERILELMPDIVIFNNLLPQLDGLGVVAKINESKLKKRPIFFMVSSFVNDTLAAEANAIGISYFLAKLNNIVDINNMIH